MLDLGASILFMPTSVYRSLHLGDLKPTSVIIQLANKSVALPLGVLDDVLVGVNDLIFPADFYILDMENESSSHGSTLILGRPLLMTVKPKIDVHAKILSTRYPAREHFVFLVDIIDNVVDSVDTCTNLLSDFFLF